MKFRDSHLICQKKNEDKLNYRKSLLIANLSSLGHFKLK
jgi:hypothetical protein